MTPDDVIRLLPANRGHFRFESGHHRAISLDVERLCVRPGSVQRLAPPFHDLIDCGAQPVVIASLLVLGAPAAAFAAEHDVALESLASLPNELWTPAACPLCARGEPLVDLMTP